MGSLKAGASGYLNTETAPEELVEVGSLKAGASGYLNTVTAPEEFVEAIRIATEGGDFISRNLAETLQLDI